MNIININDIKQYLSKQDLNIRKGSRWTDQKCTPDVLRITASTILNLINNKGRHAKFTNSDIMNSKYARDNVRIIFNKSDTRDEMSEDEYNKFFPQPMNLFSYANILYKDESHRPYTFVVLNYNLLDYISQSSLTSFKFLRLYIKEFLKQNHLYEDFQLFLKGQTEGMFNELKKKFINFYHKNTKVKKDYEPKRIFPKVLNPLALNKKGAHRGYISKEPIQYAQLMYNRDNFRDIFSGKPKDMTRREWLTRHPVKESQRAKFKLDSQKAKKEVRQFNDRYFDSKSEMKDKYDAGKATQMHHIFPQHEYPELSGYIENIIALTASQHYQKAHPNNHTREINLPYQEDLLKAKANTIDTVLNHKNWPQIYSFKRFDHVLNTGFNYYKESDNNIDYLIAMNKIEQYYMKRIS